MDSTSPSSDISLALVIGTGATTIILATALAYVLLETRKAKNAAAGTQQQSTHQVQQLGGSIDKQAYPGGLLTVYYATQTGTAESFARQIEREAGDHGFVAQVVDLEDIELSALVDESRRDTESNKARAIFLTATYGEGEAPDNATLFVQTLCEQANTKVLLDNQDDENDENGIALNGHKILQDLEYAVFGLGNIQYDHFNAMGKFFDRSLARLGGHRLMKLGLGDDDNDLEADFETWKEKFLWRGLKQKYMAGKVAVKAKKTSTEILPDCQYAIKYHTTAPGTTTTPKDLSTTDQVHSSGRHYFDAVECPVSVVRELRSPQDGDSTVHVEIDISRAAQKGFQYQTADNLGVLAQNDPQIVESVAKALGYDLDAIFSLQAAGSHEWHGAPFPMPLTVRECLSRYCDLTGPPRRSELKLLAAYAMDPLDKQALFRMSSKEGKAEYKSKVTDNLTGFVHILEKCPSIKMPLEHFIDICPRLQPRFFTISSSSTVHPQSIHLTVAVTKQQRADGTVFNGVCSTYLAQRRETVDTVRCFVRPSSFRLPADASKPILMIGPGTGVAPMRALLQERAAMRKKDGSKVGPNILYFGCKKVALDYLYKDDMEAWQADGNLQKLYTAFSRAQSNKVYVQHLLEENAAETWDLLDTQGASVYVCGAVKMGHDVGEAMQRIIISQGNRTPDEAKAYMSQLAADGRFVQELWA